MAPVAVEPSRMRAFRNARAFEAWLSKHHHRASELWLRIYKKGSGMASVDYAQAVELALCWGWIDGLRKAYDEQSFLQRFTPRKAKSRWSQINRRKVEQLIADGRMTAHGLKHVTAAKADGRWAAAYPPPSEIEVPADLLRAIRGYRAALRAYRGLKKQDLYALAFRVGNMKTAAGRARKIETLVGMLARGQPLR